MPDTLPKPAKRQRFSPRDVASVFIKCDGRCASCREKVQLDGYAIDHIQALDHLGKHELKNWQLLCRPCHAVKTASDVKASAKGRRLRNECGQAKRRAERGGSMIKSRGFDKTLRKRMDGTVVRVVK